MFAILSHSACHPFQLVLRVETAQESIDHADNQSVDRQALDYKCRIQLRE